MIFSVYSSVKHSVYLSITQKYLQLLPNPFQSKGTPAFQFLNPLICSNRALIVIDRWEDARLHTVESCCLV